MTDLEIAWIAGILEGEGCFTCDTKTTRLRVQCVMTDKDIIDRLHNIVGKGIR